MEKQTKGGSKTQLEILQTNLYGITTPDGAKNIGRGAGKFNNGGRSQKQLTLALQDGRKLKGSNGGPRGKGSSCRGGTKHRPCKHGEG